VGGGRGVEIEVVCVGGGVGGGTYFTASECDFVG